MAAEEMMERMEKPHGFENNEVVFGSLSFFHALKRV
jgi:hypothetical protein